MSQENLIPTYNPLPISFTHGDGVWLYDKHGEKYLDAYCGVAVTGLGHKHPAIIQVIQKQLDKLLHVSNLVEIPEQQALAAELALLSGFNAKSFFCTSGTEAIEGAIKLARLYGRSKNLAEPLIVVMTNSFHGRTMAALSAGDSKKKQAGFEPLVTGFIRVPYGDTNTLAQLARDNPNIVAVLLEPIQGESGVHLPPEDYLTTVREICDANAWLMILDEIQTGMGRTGKLFAYQHYQIFPDVITLAKGLANGIPIGALLVSPKYSSLFKPGSHGSTFSGNPLACAAALATLTEISQHRLWENAAKQGLKLLNGLKKALSHKQHVLAVRGKGLMLGIELDRPCREILNLALKHKIIFNLSRENIIRILPPLILGDAEVDLILQKIPTIVNEFVVG